MSRKKKNKFATQHGEYRFSERMPEGLKDHTSYIRQALMYGCGPTSFTGEFKNFLYRKSNASRKRVKVYKGYVYIFFSTSSRLVTMYKVPEEYQNECTIDGKNVNDIFVEKKKVVTE